MEPMPATLKISENARKYHFLPRKSMFVLRNSSTSKPQKSFCSPSGDCAECVGGEGLDPGRRQLPLVGWLDTQCLAALMTIQVGIENHARDEYRGKQVREQTEAQRDRKALHRPCSKQEQDDRRNDRRHVGID